MELEATNLDQRNRLRINFSIVMLLAFIELVSLFLFQMCVEPRVVCSALVCVVFGLSCNLSYSSNYCIVTA